MTETVMRTDGAAIGRADRRKEDARLLTGRTNWTDNIQLPGTLHMATLRSPMAHARILRIDTSAALALEGVAARLHRRGLPGAAPARPASGRSPTTSR